MEIKEMLLTKNRFSRSGGLLKSIKGVVVHYTANPGTTALQNRNYFEGLKDQPPNGTRYASAHYFVGLEGEVIRCLPDKEIAYHVGATSYAPLALQRLSTYPNNCTIGIEMCIDKAGNFPGETLASCKELVEYLLEEYHLTKEDVYRHYDVTGKICPKPFVDVPEAWDEFRESLNN